MKKATQIHYYRIVRRTSKYNKYIKWFAEFYRDKLCNEQTACLGYRTQREARASAHSVKDFPVGNRLISYTMEEVIR